MPYLIMLSREGVGKQRNWEATDIIYDDGQDAGLYVKRENNYQTLMGSIMRYRAVKITEDNPLMWRQREQRKFEEGIYQRVPWADEFFGANTGMYEHIDPDDPTKVRFIASQEDGLAGRYTSMTPGRFIRKYVGNVEPRDLDRWCAQMGINETTSELKLARTADEIVYVYNNGPHSCMAYKLNHPVFENVDVHPVSVYGDSDLAVAYIERFDEITARCLVWPEKKQFGRIYGDRERLLERLNENGYVENWDFTGAKIRCLTHKKTHAVIVPYIDGEDMGVIDNDDDKWLTLSNKPHVICKRPDGMTSAHKCQRCGAERVWLTAWFGPDDDYDEPEYTCAEGCKE